jgi:hypothetical protein
MLEIQIPQRRSVNHKVMIRQSGADDEDTVVHENDTIEFCPEPSDLEYSLIFAVSPFEPVSPATHGKLRFDERDCKHPLKVTFKHGDHPRAYTYVLAVEGRGSEAPGADRPKAGPDG